MVAYTLGFFGAWRSLVARIVRDDEVGGSNPLAPTTSSTTHRIGGGPVSDGVSPESPAGARWQTSPAESLIYAGPGWCVRLGRSGTGGLAPATLTRIDDG